MTLYFAELGNDSNMGTSVAFEKKKSKTYDYLPFGYICVIK